MVPNTSESEWESDHTTRNLESWRPICFSFNNNPLLTLSSFSKSKFNSIDAFSIRLSVEQCYEGDIINILNVVPNTRLTGGQAGVSIISNYT